MDQAYINSYYNEQAGNGISGFEGLQYQNQKGRGLFGRIWRGVGLPLVRYFGRKALETGRDIAGDLLEGKNLKTSARKRARQSMESMGQDAKRKLLSTIDQTGTGLSTTTLMAKPRTRAARGRKPRKGIKRRKKPRKVPPKKRGRPKKGKKPAKKTNRKKKRISFLS